MSPGCGSRMSINSPASTGTCVRVMSRRMAKALRDLCDLVRQCVLVVRVAGAVPDFEVITAADDDDVPADRRVLEQLGVERHPAGRGEVEVVGAAAEEAG